MKPAHIENQACFISAGSGYHKKQNVQEGRGEKREVRDRDTYKETERG